MDVTKAEQVPNGFGLATRFAGFLASTFATVGLMLLLA